MLMVIVHQLGVRWLFIILTIIQENCVMKLTPVAEHMTECFNDSSLSRPGFEHLTSHS